ncbi:MAG TPA: hypothetical protein VKD66_13025 [Streptosporangiaceae bacterium]|nr:hypothetical protein [Streptosporangiaceae bacterium]
MTTRTRGSETAVAAGPQRAVAVPAVNGRAVSAPWRLLAGAAGFAGAAALGASFGALPSPPALNAAPTALTGYAVSHQHTLMAAAWLEATGTALYVIFVLALVHLAGARAGFAGRVTALASAVMLAVSLVYDVMLIAIAQSAALGGRHIATALAAYGLFAATEHVFLLAPPLFLPLGLILLRTPVLPRPFALLAVIFGVVGPVLGLVGLFTVTANNDGPVGAAINGLVALQGLWVIAASLTLPLRRRQAAGGPARP